MNGRYVTYDQIDLFDGFQQQGNRGNNTTTTKNQQQRTSPFPFMNNNHHRGNGGGPCGEDYDPASLLNGNGAMFNSVNAGAQLIAAGAAAAAGRGGVGNTIPGYGLFRPAGAPNPALIQNNLQTHLQQQVAFHHHQQQQQQHRQRQQQHAVEAALIADYDSVGMQQNMRQQAASRHQRPTSNFQNMFSNDFDAPGIVSSHDVNKASVPPPKPPPPEWLKDLKIEVSGLSLEPLPGVEVMDRIEKKTSDVIKRYLPCVDFLVACQQDLRKGLILATQKRMIRRAFRDAMTPREFHKKYIAPLADRFLISNQRIMEPNYLADAYNEVKKLSDQASSVERQGSEVMKNTFLGGMKDGESWGLRKWLSKHGGALQICTDLELILSSCQKLDKQLDSTKKLAAMMRPLAKRAWDRLKADVPQSYQEISTAHPYLPFFHRLEAALRSMSNFDPEDDDVICLDDSDDEDEVVVEVKKSAPPAKASTSLKPAAKKSPPRTCHSIERPHKRPRKDTKARNVEPVARHAGCPDDDDDDDDSDSDIEIVGVVKAPGKTSGESDDDDDQDENDAGDVGWSCSSCSTHNLAGSSTCNGCKMSRDFVNDLMQFPAFEDVMNVKTGLSDDEGSVGGFGFGSASRGQSPVPARKATPTPNSTQEDPLKLSRDIDALADVFEIERQSSIRPRSAPVQPDSFWEGIQYGKALRLFAQILRSPEAAQFVNPIDDTGYSPPYGSIIKNPICFSDIVHALIPENFNNLEFDSGRSGILAIDGLKFWNMWNGQDLLQAIDLVFLNALAYAKAEGGRSGQRTEVNRLRKTLWNGIQEIISQKVGSNKELQKQHAPTKRGESSGFVIFKTRNR